MVAAQRGKCRGERDGTRLLTIIQMPISVASMNNPSSNPDAALHRMIDARVVIPADGQGLIWIVAPSGTADQISSISASVTAMQPSVQSVCRCAGP